MDIKFLEMIHNNENLTNHDVLVEVCLQLACDYLYAAYSLVYKDVHFHEIMTTNGGINECAYYLYKQSIELSLKLLYYYKHPGSKELRTHNLYEIYKELVADCPEELTIYENKYRQLSEQDSSNTVARYIMENGKLKYNLIKNISCDDLHKLASDTYRICSLAVGMTLVFESIKTN